MDGSQVIDRLAGCIAKYKAALQVLTERKQHILNSETLNLRGTARVTTTDVFALFPTKG